ncbi:siderophore ABC transporter substrate-binding protein [Romboutsia lituseburensis]|uniref:Iron complex transport system substrate-binding protein n=2 Tax=root TaxID=1 RepID=A0A1G9JBQ0_9FIRM|nr:ABC transporter substrate-binding protein [Romboutsia lituseburensis]CEH33544.1 Ferric anguibactin-binding protein [Romboutsia lituseburensis]SDL35067.1 iron complex transport system substrate-binding protein [Romboutsia lituseburensis DSM 797]
MNKKVALISGLAIVGIIGGMLVFSNKGKQESKESSKEVVKVEHALGSTEVAENPEKIVVFDYAALDAMETLDIDGVVGVAKGSSIPKYLNKYEGDEYANVGGLKEPDLEKINELDPDLIIINGRQHSFYDKLNQIAPTISLSKEDGKYMESFSHNMEVLGDIFNKEEKVDQELAKIDKKIEKINKQVTDKGYKATTLMVSDGTLSVFGEDSRFGLIYKNLGFKNTDENVKTADHGQDVSFEYVASQDSDYMFVIDKSVISSDKEQKPAAEILNNDLINNTKVAKENNIVYLDTHAWYLSDGGFISTNNMIDEISKAINK